MEVDELTPGLWRWTGRVEGRGEVASLYLETETSISLIDPVVPPEDRQRFLDALDRDVARHRGPVQVVLSTSTPHPHATELVERYGASLWTPAAGEAPADVEPLGAGCPDQVMFWIQAHRTLYAGACLYPAGRRLELASDRDRADVARALLPLLDRNVERVVCSGGAPITSEAAILLDAVRKDL